MRNWVEAIFVLKSRKRKKMIFFMQAILVTPAKMKKTLQY